MATARRLDPDPIRSSSVGDDRLTGRGPRRTYRHLHHQRGTIGHFRVRLVEGRDLRRRHWSALGLGPVRMLGLSRACGEVSSFGTLRLGFWDDGDDDDDDDDDDNYDDGDYHDDDDCAWEGKGGEVKVVAGIHGKDDDRFPREKGGGRSDHHPRKTAGNDDAPFAAVAASSAPVAAAGIAAAATTADGKTMAFMPSMPTTTTRTSRDAAAASAGGWSPLVATPLPFDSGSLRSATPSRSPFFPSFYATTAQRQQGQRPDGGGGVGVGGGGPGEDRDVRKQPSSLPFVPPPPKSSCEAGPKKRPPPTKAGPAPSGPPPPRHYARETFKTSTVHDDSNPIWEDLGQSSSSSGRRRDGRGGGGGNSADFRIPLRKDDLLPSLEADYGQVRLEVRLDEEMAPTEAVLVSGALSTALGAAAAGASVVGMGGLTRDASAAGMEMLGLGTDRLIGRGFVDLTSLLLGVWEEVWENDVERSRGGGDGGGGDGPRRRRGTAADGDDDADDDDDDGGAPLDEYGRSRPGAYRTRRRVERTGMLDVWVPLYHPTAKAAGGNDDGDDDGGGGERETSGRVRLLISYEPNGMPPKRDDVVAFESFARRPLHGHSNRDDAASSSSSSSLSSSPTSRANAGPIIHPVVPPLSPLLVIDVRGQFLLLEYPTSRTVTSVDRGGNVKSTRWERTQRVRVHRNAVFVVERHTFMDGVGDVVRYPGDVVLSTPVGREIAEVAAPLVAGFMELMGPALLWGRLVVSAGGMGLRAGLAGAQAATEAVVSASQEKALERRTEERGGGGGYAGDAGAYTYVG